LLIRLGHIDDYDFDDVLANPLLVSWTGEYVGEARGKDFILGFADLNWRACRAPPVRPAIMMRDAATTVIAAAL
jgi:hypothetical protein